MEQVEITITYLKALHRLDTRVQVSTTSASSLGVEASHFKTRESETNELKLDIKNTPCEGIDENFDMASFLNNTRSRQVYFNDLLKESFVSTIE